MQARTDSQAREGGFTLIELLVAVALMSIIGALSLSALFEYRKGLGQQQTADALLSDMRASAQRSVAEGRTYCMYVNDVEDSWTVYRGSCANSSTTVEPAVRASEDTGLGALVIATPATAACQATNACIYFYPRGTATKSSIDVTRPGKPSITITVEGLTSRVDRT